MQVLAVIQVSQSMRNTGTDSGAKGDGTGGLAVPAAAAASSAPCATAEASEGDGGWGGAVLRVLSWDGKGGMRAHCATVAPCVLPPLAAPLGARGVGLREEIDAKKASSAYPESARSYLIYSI
jgi:hypothetical protein